jgi:hypothetical protein
VERADNFGPSEKMLQRYRREREIIRSEIDIWVQYGAPKAAFRLCRSVDAGNMDKFANQQLLLLSMWPRESEFEYPAALFQKLWGQANTLTGQYYCVTRSPFRNYKFTRLAKAGVVMCSSFPQKAQKGGTPKQPQENRCCYFCCFSVGWLATWR